jgi:hypothetical protein
MNIEDLKLTHEELLPFVWTMQQGGDPTQDIADLATAKALWGIVDLIPEKHELHGFVGNGTEAKPYVCLKCSLEYALNQAGIPNPFED